MKYLIFQMIFMVSLFSQAVVHVGNGGGDAEMTVLQMAPNLGLWAQACNENPGLCAPGSPFSKSDFKYLGQKINFVEAREHKTTCEGSQVNIVRESLYINLDRPKSPNELSAVLIKTILFCAGWPSEQLAKINFDLDPRQQTFTDFNISVFQGSRSDIIISPMSSGTNRRLIQRTECSKYRITSASGNDLNLRCLENNLDYLVRVKTASEGLDFISRINDPEF